MNTLFHQDDIEGRYENFTKPLHNSPCWRLGGMKFDRKTPQIQPQNRNNIKIKGSPNNKQHDEHYQPTETEKLALYLR